VWREGRGCFPGLSFCEAVIGKKKRENINTEGTEKMDEGTENRPPAFLSRLAARKVLRSVSVNSSLPFSVTSVFQSFELSTTRS